MSSPTIRVNGTDICNEVRESDCGDLCGSSVNCRVFVYEGIECEQPPAAMIADGILRVLYGRMAADNKPYILPDNLNTFFSGMPADKYSPFDKQPADDGCCCTPVDGKCC